MFKVIYAVLCVVVFALGGYIWKIKRTGTAKAELEAKSAPEAQPLQHAPGNTVVVEVGGDKLTQDDIDWEYRLVTAELDDKESLTPIPDLGNRLQAELAPLKKRIVADIIERKLLYRYLQQDKEWTHDDPARFTACMGELKATLADNPRVAESKDAKSRLRHRLCERSIIEQYMKDRIFTGLAVPEPEVVEYFKNHMAEFKQPERVEIRQIVLATDGEAKKIRNQVTQGNFEAMARQHSIAPEAEDGGRLGPFSKAALPSAFEMAFHMKKGEISDILKSPYGYHIIMLLAKHPKSEMSLDEARAKISAILLKKKREDRYREWLDKALAAVAVTQPKPLW